MMPAYRFADSDSRGKSQMSFPQYQFPSSHANPPESWPHRGNCNYGMPMPVPFHSCYNPNHFPGYSSFGYPCPHPPVTSYFPMPYCGGHGRPACPEPYHFQYQVPPPHYTMEQPRYEYDKNVPGGYHCCACPSHVCDQKADQRVQIEEQEPDVERKGSDSVVPVRKPDQYPIVWIPSDFENNKDHTKQYEKEAVKQEGAPRESKPHEPQLWNGWYPLDLNELASCLQGEQERRAQSQQNEDDERKQFPWESWLHSGEGTRSRSKQSEEEKKQSPLSTIWMPYYNWQNEAPKDAKKMKSNRKAAEETPYTIKYVPVDCSDKDENEEKSDRATGMVKAKSGDDVKLMVTQKEKENSKEMNKGGRDIPDKGAKDHAEQEHLGTGGKRQSTSPPKSSKLPPVCLRIDPLPKKRSNNGSSRSPSRLASKTCSQESSNGTAKVSTSSSVKGKSHSKSDHSVATSKSKEVEPEKEKIVKVIEVKSSENEDIENESRDAVCKNDSKAESFKEIAGAKQERKNEEDEGAENVTKMKTRVVESVGVAKKAKAMALSDVEAALLIQSAYRGYLVRRWEPLKKLKQINEIRGQVKDIENRIEALESSSALAKDDKETVVIGEMIMRLLLKLDTIQGLHASVRESRKSLARELVSLQEKLDSLMPKKSEEAIQSLVDKPEEDSSIESHESGTKQEQPKEGSGERSSEGVKDVEPVVDDMSQFRPESTLEDITSDEPQRPLENESEKSSTLYGEKLGGSEFIQAIESEADQVDSQVVKTEKTSSQNTESELPAVSDEKPEVYKVDSDLISEPSMEDVTGGHEAGQALASDMKEATTEPFEPTASKLLRTCGEVHYSKEVCEDLDGSSQVENPVEGTNEVSRNNLETENLMITEEHLGTKELEQVEQVETGKEEVFQAEGEMIETEHERPLQDEELNATQDHKIQNNYRGKVTDIVPSVVEVDDQRVDVEDEYDKPQDLQDNACEKEVPLEENEEQTIDVIKKKEENIDVSLTDQLSDSQTVKEEVLLQTPAEEEGEPEQVLEHVTVGENEANRKLTEENEKLREMMEKLIEAGKEQLNVISNLSGRVKELEKKLARKKKARTHRNRGSPSRFSCSKPS